MLAGASLQNADLLQADLQEANLANAKLQHAMLTGAMLRGAILNTANLDHAHLDQADLSGADLANAKLRGTDLIQANLSNADLREADLKGAKLSYADISNANFRGAKGFTLDDTYVRDTHFDPASKDRWSILRRKYSGPMFFIHIVFLLIFLGTYGGRAMFWVGVNGAQESLNNSQKFLLKQIQMLEKADTDAFSMDETKLEALLSEKGFETGTIAIVLDIIKNRPTPPAPVVKAAAYNNVLTKLSNVTLCLRLECQKPQPIWRVLLRYEYEQNHRYFPFILATALLVYNILRGFLTWRVGILRDAEERSGYSPGYFEYVWMYWLHALVMLPLFVIAIAAIAYNGHILLFETPVVLPKPGI